MILLIKILSHALAAGCPLVPAALLHWTIARGQSRGNTFFGVRVEPDFPHSSAGQAILHRFHLVLWFSAAMSSAVTLDLPLALAAPMGCMTCSLLSWLAFGMAHSSTRKAALPRSEPTVRVASLAMEQEPSAIWLTSIDWLVMLIPPAVPIATLILLAINGKESDPHAGTFMTVQVFVGLLFCLYSSANQWALRFRARSSDWAPQSGASRRFRTYLGAMQATVFVFIALQLCFFGLKGPDSPIPAMRGGFATTYFLIIFPVEALWLISVYRMRAWLAKHLALASSDPMPDACWKWGSFYYNPDDPVLMVPLRTGIGQSFNYARPSVWIVSGILTAGTILSVIQTIQLVLQMNRRFPGL